MVKKLLEIKNINKTFDANNATTHACKDVSLNVYENELLGIVGESGSGKSTLMKLITNLEMKTSGEVLYEGVDLTTLKDKELKPYRKDIQILFQDTTSSLNPKMKVKKIICEPLRNYKLISKKQTDEIALQYLKMVELDETFLNKYPSEMSGGQRQRVALARALTLKPKILILDEPTSALDVITQSKIIDLILRFRTKYNLTILFISHDIALISKISDRVIVMKKGQIIEEVKPQKILTSIKHPYTKSLVDSVFTLNG